MSLSVKPVFQMSMVGSSSLQFQLRQFDPSVSSVSQCVSDFCLMPESSSELRAMPIPVTAGRDQAVKIVDVLSARSCR